MTINKIKDGSKLTISLEGKLDTKSAPELDSVLKNETEGITDLRLEMDGVKYISSAGLRVLLAAEKLMRKNGKILITCCNDNILEIFDMTGFTDLLTIG